MKREEFLTALARRLRRLPKAEREEALAFYREYLDEAGEKREAETLAALGDPKEVARQIIQEAAIKVSDPEHEEGRSFLASFRTILLGVCAASVSIPLTAVALIGLAVVILVALSLMAGGILALASGIFCGGVSILYGAAELISSPADGMVVIGIGLVMTALGILLFLGLLSLGRILARAFRRAGGAVIRRQRGGTPDSRKGGQQA